MIPSFANTASEDLFNGVDSRAARTACPVELWPVPRRKMTQLSRVTDLRELAIPPGNRLERLTGPRRGQHSIRVNQQFRLGVSFPRLNEIVRGKRSVTPDSALRLAQVTGMSAEFWPGLQLDWELWHALRSDEAKAIAKLSPLPRAS